MLKRIGLRNFKSFGPDMEEAPLSRVTLIYGPNSSGKSSIIQALLLLKQSLEGTERWSKRELIPSGDHVDLGSIPALVHKHDTESEIGIRLTYGQSYLPNVESSVELTFEAERSEAFSPTKDNSVLSAVHYRISLKGEMLLHSALRYKYGDDSIAWDTHLSVTTKSLKAEDNVRISSFEDGISYLPEVKLARPRRGGLLNRIRREVEGESSLAIVRDNARLRERIQEERHSANAMRRKLSSLVYDLHVQQRKLEDEKSDIFAFLLRDEEITPQAARARQRALRRMQTGIQEKRSDLNEVEEALRSAEENIRALETEYGAVSPQHDQRMVAVNRISRATERSYRGTATRALSAWDEPIHWNGLESDEFLALVPESIPRDYERCLQAITHIGPAREQPERVYRVSSSDKNSAGIRGEHTPHIMYRNPEVKREVNRWLGEFEIPYEIDVIKDSGDIHLTGERLLVELIDKRTATRVSLADVGFGISCVLPIIVEGVASREGSVICVEQPELHLHPRLQAHVANLMVATSADEPGKRKQWIVETHSELLQLRLSALIAAKEHDFRIEAKDVSILFVSPPDEVDDTLGSTIRDLNALDDGELGEDWPPGFFDESTEEMMKIIRSQRN